MSRLRLITELLDRGYSLANIIAPLGDPLPAEAIPRLTELVTSLRPLAERAVDAELARAMDRLIRARLRGDMQSDRGAD